MATGRAWIASHPVGPAFPACERYRGDMWLVWTSEDLMTRVKRADPHVHLTRAFLSTLGGRGIAEAVYVLREECPHFPGDWHAVRREGSPLEWTDEELYRLEQQHRSRDT